MPCRNCVCCRLLGRSLAMSVGPGQLDPQPARRRWRGGRACEPARPGHSRVGPCSFRGRLGGRRPGGSGAAAVPERGVTLADPFFLASRAGPRAPGGPTAIPSGRPWQSRSRPAGRPSGPRCAAARVGQGFRAGGGGSARGAGGRAPAGTGEGLSESRFPESGSACLAREPARADGDGVRGRRSGPAAAGRPVPAGFGEWLAPTSGGEGRPGCDALGRKPVAGVSPGGPSGALPAHAFGLIARQRLCGPVPGTCLCSCARTDPGTTRRSCPMAARSTTAWADGSALRAVRAGSSSFSRQLTRSSRTRLVLGPGRRSDRVRRGAAGPGTAGGVPGAARSGTAPAAGACLPHPRAGRAPAVRARPSHTRGRCRPRHRERAPRCSGPHHPRQLRHGETAHRPAFENPQRPPVRRHPPGPDRAGSLVEPVLGLRREAADPGDHER